MFDTSIICRSSRWVAQVTPSISPISNPTYICPNLFHSLSEAVQCIAGLHESLQPCSRAARKWRENEEMRRKWRENEEMERDWLSTFPHSLSISSLFLHFLPLFPFPTSKCITFCCKMLNTALLSRMSQKSQHTRYEEIILGRTCCEEAPQFVPACTVLYSLKPSYNYAQPQWKYNKNHSTRIFHIWTISVALRGCRLKNTKLTT